MRKTLFLNLLLLAALFMTGCSGSNEETNFTFGKGNYKFTMWDSTGKRLVDGTLNVMTKSNNEITGTYKFTKVYENDFSGMSSMDGEFSGNINSIEKKVFINTNPKIADSNVFWNMLIYKSSVSGEWNYSVFRGMANKGKIKITK